MRRPWHLVFGAAALLALGCDSAPEGPDTAGPEDAGLVDAPGVDGPEDAALVDAPGVDGPVGTNPLVATPATLDFGMVVNKPTTPAMKTVTLTNTGASPLTVTEAHTTGAGYSVDSTALPSPLGAGKTMTLTVSFAPMVGGPASGNLLVSDDASADPVVVSLTGISYHVVILTWNASTSPNVVGYNVYRGMTMGGPYPDKLNSTPVMALTYTDATVMACATYYYVVTAVDNTGAESTDSGEVEAVIPCP